MVVRVKVCDSTFPAALESNCKAYTSSSGPRLQTHRPAAGLRRERPDVVRPDHGLLRASNTDGGVLRKAWARSRTRSTRDGTFNTGVDRHHHDAQSPASTTGFNTRLQLRLRLDRHWLRSPRRVLDVGQPDRRDDVRRSALLRGQGRADDRVLGTFGAGEESQLSGVGLPVATWDNPYAARRRALCAKPFETVISDINPSYDSDKLPGTAFGAYTGDMQRARCRRPRPDRSGMTRSAAARRTSSATRGATQRRQAHRRRKRSPASATSAASHPKSRPKKAATTRPASPTTAQPTT